MKVAIIGTAPHCVKAPYGDPTWEIWGANAGTLPRWDRWFDFHDDASIDTYPGHREFLATNHGKPVYMRAESGEFPHALRYPVEDMAAKYGTWFFTSTIAYMLALAIEHSGVTDIGLWGVDMAHDSEYATQKPGCRFFVQVARMAGIHVTMPPEAEVGVPGRLYCFDPPKSGLQIKAEGRLAELQGRLEECQRDREALAAKRLVLTGALDPTLKITVPSLLQDQLKAVLAAEAQKERDAILLDGAVQNASHIVLNWF